MRRVSERERAIRQFVIVKNKLMSVFIASVLLLKMRDHTMIVVVVIDHEFCHHIVKVVCRSTRLSPRGSTATLTM